MMPGYSGNNRNQNDRRRWNGGGGGGPQRGRRNDGRSLQDRMQPMQRGMISPWESGIAPSMGNSLLGDFQQSNMHNQYILNRAMNRNNMSGNGYDNMPNKIRRLDMNYSTISRNSNLQQRLGNTSSVGMSPAARRASSAYYPSDHRRDNNLRKTYKQPNRQSRPARGSRDRPRYNDKKSSKETDKDIAKDDDAKSQSKDDESEKDKDASDTKAEASPKKEESTDKEMKEIIEETFPSDALYCHICDLETFATKKGYIRHLEGISHSRMADQFHDRNAALLEFLNVSAKFAEMRRRDKLLRTTSTRNAPLGVITEKVILQKYMDSRVCCKEKFNRPYDYHEHKLSVHHLKYFHEKSIKDKQYDAERSTLASVEDMDEMLKTAKEESAIEPLTANNIPNYDPQSTFGMQYIEKKVLYGCDLCKGNPFTLLSEHCQSFKHYEKIIAAINKEEEKKMEEERKIKEEEMKAEQEKEVKEEPAQKYERRLEDDCDSNFSDKNEDQKDFLSYEDYMKDDDEMIILDEEKNEDALGEEPPSILEFEKKDDNLSEEPQTILEDMNDEPNLEYDIHDVGEDLEEMDDTENLEEVMEDIDEPTKRASPRRSSRVRQ